MARQVNGADWHRMRVDRVNKPITTRSPERQQVILRLPELLFRFGNDHGLADGKAFFVEQPVFRKCQPNSFGAAGEGYFRLSAFNSRANVDDAMARIQAL